MQQRLETPSTAEIRKATLKLSIMLEQRDSLVSGVCCGVVQCHYIMPAKSRVRKSVDPNGGETNGTVLSWLNSHLTVCV